MKLYQLKSPMMLLKNYIIILHVGVYCGTLHIKKSILKFILGSRLEIITLKTQECTFNDLKYFMEGWI